MRHSGENASVNMEVDLYGQPGSQWRIARNLQMLFLTPFSDSRLSSGENVFRGHTSPSLWKLWKLTLPMEAMETTSTLSYSPLLPMSQIVQSHVDVEIVPGVYS